MGKPTEIGLPKMQKQKGNPGIIRRNLILLAIFQQEHPLKNTSVVKLILRGSHKSWRGNCKKLGGFFSSPENFAHFT